MLCSCFRVTIARTSVIFHLQGFLRTSVVGYRHEVCAFNYKGTKNVKMLMALFKVTTRARKLTNGILIEPGMSVEMATVSAVNPITANGGQAVADAFMRVYGIDLKKAGALNSAYLEATKIK